MPVTFDRTVRTQIEKQLTAAERKEMFREVAKAVSVVAVGLILLLLLRSVFHTLQIGKSISLEGGVEHERDALEGAELAAAGASPEKQLPAPEDESLSAIFGESEGEGVLESETPEEVKEIKQLQEEVVSMIQSDPEAVALLIQNWLSEKNSHDGQALQSPEIEVES